MKKARIILSALALVAVVGGAVAFKATKFTGAQAFTFTRSYTTFGTVYTLAPNVSTYLPFTSTKFFTNAGALPTTVYSTTGVVANQTITLTRQGGTETITFPVWQGQLITSTFTTTDN